MSASPSRDVSPNRSSLSSQTESSEVPEESHSLSQGSSCASISTDQDLEVTPRTLSKARAWIEDIIGRLNDLSRSIRKSVIVQSDGRGENFIPRDDTGKDLRPEFVNYARLVVQREIPKASDWLQERLLDSISRRWSRILYRRRHQQKLSRMAQSWETSSPNIDQLSVNRTADLVSAPLDARVRREFHTPEPLSKEPTISSTNLSTVPVPKPPVVETLPAPDLSRKTRSSVKNSKLDIPRPPKSVVRNNVFQCPYCCILCPMKEASSRFWKLVSRVC